MWSSPITWCPLLGVFLYSYLIWDRSDSLERDRRQIWLLAAFCVGTSVLFFVPTWLIAALGYDTTLSQMLKADVPGWQFRKTVYLCYSLLTCAGLSAIHGIALYVCRGSHGSGG